MTKELIVVRGQEIIQINWRGLKTISRTTNYMWPKKIRPIGRKNKFKIYKLGIVWKSIGTQKNNFKLKLEKTNQTNRVVTEKPIWKIGIRKI